MINIIKINKITINLMNVYKNKKIYMKLQKGVWKQYFLKLKKGLKIVVLHVKIL